MIKSIRLTKTPTKNSSTLLKHIEKVYQSILTPLLESHLLGEGVYGFESATNCDDTENFLIAPSFMRNLIGKESYRDYMYLLNSFNRLHCYHIILDKPSFLPLYVEEPTSLIQQFQLLQSGTNEIYVQFLFSKRSDMWQYELIDQYKSFLDGNDWPSPTKTGRKVQEKMLNVIIKLGNFDMKRQEIEEISQKILENGYRFELKVVIYEENHEKLHKIELEMEEILKEMDFFNQLGMYKSRNKKQFMSDYLSRRFTDISKNQMLSESELICMCSDEIVERESKTVEGVIEEARNETVSVRNVSNKSMFNLLPLGEKKDREIDHKVSENLMSAIERVGIKNGKLFTVDNSQVGATLQKISVQIPQGANYSDIKKNYENIQASLGNNSISMEIGDKPNTVNFYIPCSEREIVYLRSLLETEEFITFVKNNPLPIVLGEDSVGKPLLTCLAKLKHILIAGATGSGKSVFLNTLILVWILYKKPDEIQLHLVDPKKVELPQYRDLPHVANVISDMDKAEALFDYLVTEMDNRYELMSKLGYKDIDHYNGKSKKKMTYNVCVVDEMSDLMDTHGDEIENHIIRLGQKARGAGIHLVLCTQKPSADVITTRIKSNMPSAISFRLKTSSDYMTVFGKGIPFQLLGKGDGVAMLEGEVKEFIRFQSPIISPSRNEEDEMFEALKEEYKSNRDVFGVEGIRSPKEDENAHIEPIERLKGIIIETRETRVKELQQEMGIGINKVHDMMKRLVDEGFLVKVNNRYEIADIQSEQVELSNDLLQEVMNYIIQTQRVSPSNIQNEFKIDYPTASLLIEKMEEMKIISKYPWRVLINN